MVNSLLKMLMALTSVFFLTSDQMPQTITTGNEDATRTLKYLEEQGNWHKHEHGEMCGYDRKLKERMEKDPEYAREVEHYRKVIMPQLIEQERQRRARGEQPPIYTVPLVFHLVHRASESPGTGLNLADQAIFDAVNTLNQDFQAQNAGYEEKVPDRMKPIRGNAEIHFCLAEFDPEGNPTNGIHRIVHEGPYSDDMHTQLSRDHRWDTQRYYNIYVVPIITGAAGYAYLPSGGTRGNSVNDRTVVDNAYVGAGVPVLTHEIGHAFGLYHTFQGGCGGDDGIEDTPLQGTTSRDAPRGGRTLCNGPNPPTGPISCDDIEHNWVNFMDYTSFSCMAMFTQGQVDIMRGVLSGNIVPLTTGVEWTSRNNLVQSTATVAPACSPSVPPGGGGGPGPDPDPVINDAGIRSIIEPSEPEFCASGEITPVVLLTNDFGEADLTSCEINYRVVGVPGVTRLSWEGSLATGEQEEVTLAPFDSPSVSYDLTVWTSNPNGGEDDNGFNNEKVIGQETIAAAEPNVIEDFEPTDFNPTDKQITRFNPNNDRTWERTTVTSAYGVGDACTVMRNYQSQDAPGREDWLITPLFDFSFINNPRLTFDVAALYVTNLSEFDTLEVRVSTDCGETFPNVVWKKGGQDLATLTKGFGPEFVPTAEEWRNEKASLTAFEGTEKLYVALVNKGYRHNNIYIDNLNLAEGCASDVTSEFVDVQCGGDCTGSINLNLTGFEAPAQITWSANAQAAAGTQSIDGLCAGEYSVTVVDPVFNCEFVEEIVISEPWILDWKPVVTPEVVFVGSNSGSISLGVDGGSFSYTYEWSDGSPETDYRANLAPGVYCVTVTDTNGCSLEGCFEVQPFGCELDIEVIINYPECGSGEPITGEVVVTGVGILGYNTFWSAFFNQGDTHPNLPVGGPQSVFVTETPLPGVMPCEAEVIFTVYDPSPPAINPSILHESFAGAENGSIDLNTQGDSDYTYAWDNGETSESLDGLAAGFYTVTVTDVNTGCFDEFTIQILVLDCNIDISYDFVEPNCFNGNDGSLSVTVAGGNNPTSSWDNAGINGLNPSGLSAGTYTLVVEDDDGCRIVQDIFLSQPGILDIDFTVTDESVPSAQDGTIDAAVTGGTPDYTYVWSNGSTNSSVNGLGGGTYTVTVTDGNGCTTVKGATVQGTVCPEFTVDASQEMPDCFEGTNGSITIATEGPLGPFTYAWSDDGSADSETRTNIPAGEYTVTITDEDSGCTSTQMYVIEPREELTLTVTGSDESLQGAADGTATATGLGGTGTLTYLWDNGETTQTITGLAPGEYCVDVTDENECTTRECYTVTAGSDPCVNSALGVDLNTGTLTCNITEIDIVATDGGGQGTSTYLWSDGSDGAVLTVALPGEYTVIVTDELGCTVEASVIIDQDVEDPAISLSTTPETLPSAADGTVTVMTTNAPNATYEWLDATGTVVGTTATVMNLAPGNYCVLVTNTDNGCITENCIEVLAGEDPCANSSISVDVETGVLDCNNPSLDLVAVDAGGEGTLSYAWSEGSTTQVITVTEAGEYTVMITDELGCTSETTAIVTENFEEPDLSISSTDESTQDANDGTASANVVGNLDDFAFVWSGPNGFTASTETITDLAPGEYCCVVTNITNGCTSENCTMVFGGSDPCANGIEVNVNNISSQPTITCINESVTIESAISGGTTPYEYLWNTGSEDESIEVNEAGEYTLIITDANGCTATTAIDVEADLAIPDFVVEQTNETTTGASDGVLTMITTEDDVTWEWTDMNGMVISTDETVEGLAPGEYCVEITFTNTGCSNSNCFVILEGGDPCAESPIVIINSLSAPVLTCIQNVVALEATGTGGNGDLTYLWSFDALDGPVIEVTEPGAYTVIVTDENGCTAESTIEVSSDDSLPSADATATAETSSGASDGTVTVVIDPTSTVEWFDPNGNSISTEATVEGLEPGTYCAVITNPNNGCITETCIDVLEGDDPCIGYMVIAETTAVLCAGDSNGSADVEVTGGTGPFDVTLNGLPITSFTGNTFTTPSVLPAGATVIQITDANGCTFDLELEVNEPDQIEVAVSSTTESIPGAEDGSASANGSGGTGSYTYEWSNGETTQEIDNLPAGEYCVTITDENDCSTESCVEVSQGADPCENFEVFLSTGDVSCFGGSDGFAGIETSGSSGDLLITWSNGMSGLNVELPAGTYTVEVTDANDCSDVFEFEISEPAEIVVDVTPMNESSLGAEDGSADSQVSGGTGTYTYSWTGANNFTSGAPDIEGLSEGTYCLSVIDENGCVSEEVCVEIASGADPCIGFEGSISVSDVACNGDNTGEAVVEIFNGALPYTYDWSIGNSSTSTNTGLPAGNVTVVVTDANGCQVTLEDVIEEPSEALQVVVANVTAETDTGAGDGTIQIEIVGGTFPFELQWSNGGTSDELDELPCGNYFVTVSDANGCTAEATATVPCEDLGCETLTADIQVDAVSCFGDTDGQIEIFPSGGTGPYEVSLNSGQAGTSITDLPASLYVVIVEDANGCQFTDEVTVPSPAALETEIFETNGICGAMGIAQVIPFGGTSPYLIEWSNGSNAGVITNLDSGTYTVTITDANGCVTTNLATVENNFDPLEYDVQIGNVDCNGGENGFINVEVTIGQGPFTYEWSNGATSPELFDLPAGKYTLVITDGNGCEYALSRDIIEPNPIEMDYVVNQGGTSTTFDVTLNVSGGTAPYSFDWSDGSNSIVNTGVTPGTYTVIITDDRGCEQTFEVVVDGTVTGIEGLDILESFKVYPNPTQDELFFVAELSEYAQLDIVVYNALGQLIFRDKAEGATIKKMIDLRQQAIGTYFLQVGNANGQVVEKILKIE